MRIGPHDDRIRVGEIQTGDDDECARERSECEASALIAQNGHYEPAQHDDQPAHEDRRLKPQLGDSEIADVQLHALNG